MRLYDFECANGHKHEELFRDSEEIPKEKECPTCNQPATRVDLYARVPVRTTDGPATFSRK